MDRSNKSDINLFTPGKYKSIAWGGHTNWCFSSDNRITAGTVFRNNVSALIDFAGGPQLLWSTAPVLRYQLNDTFTYHMRGNTSLGRNTAFRQQSYFYATAGFDQGSEKRLKSYLDNTKLIANRYKYSNYVLMFLSKIYQIMNLSDTVWEKIIRQPGMKWTDTTREALQRTTSGLVYALDKIRMVSNTAENFYFMSGKWKDLLREDYRPNSLMQVDQGRGVFLGAQYPAPGRANERTAVAVYVDNTIRLRASVVPTGTNDDPSKIFYPRDVQAQSNMQALDWLSPAKAVSEVKSRKLTEPVEYAAFNGFKGNIDSDVQIAPGQVSILAPLLQGDAGAFSLSSVTEDALKYQQLKRQFDEIDLRVQIAQRQLEAIATLIETPSLKSSGMAAADLAMAPLVAMAEAGDLVRRKMLLAQANLIYARLLKDKVKLSVNLQSAETAASLPAAKRKVTMTKSPEFFALELDHGVQAAKISGTAESLSLAKNADSKLVLENKQATLILKETGLVIEDKAAAFGHREAYLEVGKKDLVLVGGGGAIKMKNNSVTIGDLKVTGLSGATKLDELEKAKADIEKLEKRLDEKEKKAEKLLQDKDKEISRLTAQLLQNSQASNTGGNKKKRK